MGGGPRNGDEANRGYERAGRRLGRARPHLRRTIGVALLVGTVIFRINQPDVVLRHRATNLTYAKSASTYLVPFCVSNYGILVATRRSPRGDR